MKHVSVGMTFPKMDGSSLQIQPVTIPVQSAAELTLVLLGFTHAAGQQMEPWVDGFKRAFTGRQLDYYKIAMVGDLPQAALDDTVGAMVKATPMGERAHILAVRGNLAAWHRRFSVEQETDAYLYLLDHQGVVRWKGVGPFCEDGFNELVEAGWTALGCPDSDR